MKIALANAKGGCGKTSSSMFIAAAAQRDGYSVEVWDTDPQATATSWAEYSEGEVTFPVVSTNRVTVNRPEKEGQIIFIDTPAGSGSTIEDVIKAADLVIVPMIPSLSDLHQTRQIASVVKDNPLAILIVAANASAKAPQQLKDSLIEEGYAVFPTMIPQREDIRKAFAGQPGDLHGYQYIWEMIKEAMNV